MRIDFCWIKIQGYSYIGRIVYFDESTCNVEVDGIVFVSVPHDEVFAIKDCSLPWEK